MLTRSCLLTMVSTNLAEGHWELPAEQPITAKVTNFQGGEAEVRLQYITTWKRVLFQSDIREHACTQSPYSVLCVYCVHANNVCFTLTGKRVMSPEYSSVGLLACG